MTVSTLYYALYTNTNTHYTHILVHVVHTLHMHIRVLYIMLGILYNIRTRLRYVASDEIFTAHHFVRGRRMC